MFDVDGFESNICSECSICKREAKGSSDLCFMIYQLEPEKFLGKVVKTGKIVDKSKIIDRTFLRSPSGFMELICNPTFCPAYNGRCNDAKQRMVCYHYWLNGSYTEPTEERVTKLLLAYQKEATDKIIGGQLKIEKAWESLPKKKRKKMLKAIKRLVQKFCKTTTQTSQKNTKTKKKKKEEKKEATTTIFYNDRPEWVAHVKAVLNI